MPGRPRRNRYEIQSQHKSTRELVHHLLVTELGAVLVPDSDKTVPQPWAAPRLTEEEMTNMGMFDKLQKAGVDLGAIDLNPSFNYPDGLYTMAFAGAEWQPGKEAGWPDQIQMTYLIVSGVGGDQKYRGKKYTEWLRIPQPEQMHSDDPEIAKRANGALNKTFQRLYQIGVANPKEADVPEINAFRGHQYYVQLDTPKENNDKEKQWIKGNIKPVTAESESNSKSPFDDDEE